MAAAVGTKVVHATEGTKKSEWGTQGGGPEYDALARAIDHHKKFETCFKTKIKTGYCSYGGDAAEETGADQAFQLAIAAGARLERLGSGFDCAALVYHAHPDGKLNIFLLDETGLVRHWEVAANVTALSDGLRLDLNVGARALSRSAVPLGDDSQTPTVSPPTTLDQVSDILLPPAFKSLLRSGTYERILVLPSGAIGQIPFSALPLGNGTMVVDHASVIILPTPDALFPKGLDEAAETALSYNYDPRNAVNGRKLLVGNPDYGSIAGWVLPPLPGSEAEVNAVSRLFSSSVVLTGRKATRKAIMSELANVSREGGIVYLATHGVSDSVNPMDGSFLAVAQDLIYARTIRDLKLSTSQPLVVMSACQSGLGKTFAGGGFGIARAWYAAGAGQVVASLWNVDDVGTSILMQAFMIALVEGRASSETALRAAMIHVRDNYTKDPAIWASFILFGNPSG